MTALAAPAGPLLAFPADFGRFRWDVAGRTTTWSDSVHRLHGYRPDQIVPSAALALSHKHPQDLYDCVDALHAGIQTDRLVVHEHRIVDAGGAVRPVVLVARPVQDGSGPVRQLCGFLLPTDADPDTADLQPQRGAATLIPVLVHAFEVSAPTAAVLLAASRRLPSEPASRPAAAADRADSRRRNLEDILFPLEHLALPAVELAA